MSNAGARYDVVFIGGGNAALTAAFTARELGARVLVLECAPRALRGGNSRHTRNLRCAHAAPTVSPSVSEALLHMLCGMGLGLVIMRRGLIFEARTGER